MKIEHIAFDVPDPVAMAEWYCKHLGMRIVRQTPPPVNCRFLADDAGNMLEIYNNSSVTPPDYAGMNMLLMHIAMKTADIAADRQRLIAAGATPEGDIATTPDGDKVCTLRDPWGVALQLAQRVKPLT